MRLSATTFRRLFCFADEAMAWVGAQIHFVMSPGNIQRLRQLAWSGQRGGGRR